MQFIAQPFGDVRLGEFLQNNLGDPQWTSFRAAVAFVKRSGTQHIVPVLREFSNRAEVRMSVGVDLYGTSREALQDLLKATQSGQVFIYRNNGPFTFHPKVYLFKSDLRADLVVGSGNLTGGGLFTNYEASLGASLDLRIEADATFLHLLEATMDLWSQPQPGLCYALTEQLLDQLVAADLVRSEEQLKQMREAAIAQQQQANVTAAGVGTTVVPPTVPPLFTTFAVPPAAVVAAPPGPAAMPVTAAAAIEEAEEETVAAAAETLSAPAFVISVLAVDLPVPGSSNEVTITKHIRNARPDFWSWTGAFTGPDPVTGQYRRNVRIRYEDHLVNGYLIDFPARKPDGTKASADFRLGSIAPIVADLPH